MSKDNQRQKNKEGKQLKLFTPFGEPIWETGDGIATPTESGVDLSSLLAQRRTLTQNILERVVDYGNLDKAYRKVKSNKGSSGIDEMSVEELGQWLGKHLNKLQKSVLKGKHQVSPVREVELKKPDGGTRMLGIPTTKDRLIQQAMHQQLNLYYDPWFSESSFGFRPGRSAQQAILQSSQYVREGKQWVVDIDLEKFFDKINHDRLMQRLSKGIGDKRLLRLIHSYLKAGIMTGGLVEQRTSGHHKGARYLRFCPILYWTSLTRSWRKGVLAFVVMRMTATFT